MSSAEADQSKVDVDLDLEVQNAPIAEAGTSKFLIWLLIIGGIIALYASFDLTVEKMKVLADPTYQPSCSINPILSCGSVMTKSQASTFGIANSLFGMIGFAITTTIGMTLLAGATFKRWFWWGLEIATVLALASVHYLIFQTLYRIGALCPYCMVVWVVIIPTFVYLTAQNLRSGVISASAGARSFGALLFRYGWALVVLWYAIIFALIIMRFPNLFG